MEDKNRLFLLGVRRGLLIMLFALEQALNIAPAKRHVIIIQNAEEEETEK